MRTITSAAVGFVLAGALILPGCSSHQVSSQDLEQRLEELGYEVLGKKVDDPANTNYIILFPEAHGGNTQEIADTIKVLGKHGLFRRIGLENYVGKTGENLIDETNKLYANKKFLHLDPKSPTIKAYGDFLTQKFEVPAYGLEEPKEYDLGVCAKDIEFEETVLGFSDNLHRVSKGEKGYPCESVERAMPNIKNALERLEIVYDNTIFQDANAWRHFYWEITPQLRKVKVDDRNHVFLEKFKPGDCIPIGHSHIPSLVKSYDGNVFVVSSYNLKTNPNAPLYNKFLKKELGFTE